MALQNILPVADPDYCIAHRPVCKNKKGKRVPNEAKTWLKSEKGVLTPSCLQPYGEWPSARLHAVGTVGGPCDRVGDVLTTPLGGAVVRDPHVHTQARERLSWSPRHVCLIERWRMKDSWSSHADEG